MMTDIRRIRLFSALSSAAQRALSAVAVARRLEDGQVVVLEGEMEAPVFFILRGTVRVYRTNLEGREQNVIRLYAGDAFNMPAAFAGHGVAPASAVAVDQVELLSIPIPDFRRVVSETPEIALAVLRDFSQKLYHLTELTHNLGLRSVRGRLAQFLLAHAQADAKGGSLARWTHHEIAAQVGTVREVVSRTLRAFVREGVIEMQRHRIIIADPDALAREAES